MPGPLTQWQKESTQPVGPPIARAVCLAEGCGAKDAGRAAPACVALSGGEHGSYMEDDCARMKENMEKGVATCPHSTAPTAPSAPMVLLAAPQAANLL